MDVELVMNHGNPRRIGVMDIHQRLYLLSIILFGANWRLTG